MEEFDKIIKEKLEKHNGKVKAGAWAGISAGIAGQAATGTGIFSSTALTYISSIAATIVITSSVVIWGYSDDNNQSQEPKHETVAVVDITTEEENNSTDKQLVQNLTEEIEEFSKEDNYLVEPIKEDAKKIEVKKIKKEELFTNIFTSPSGGYAPLNVSFNHETAKNLTIRWDFGDGTESYANAPTHKYEHAGTYIVKITATNSNGQQIEETKVIEVKESSYISDLTRVITPNGDGLNDVLKVESKNLTEYHLSIFDKQGNLVFETQNTKDVWDGTKNGKKLYKGIYLYSVKAKGVDGKEYDLDGKISLK